MFKNETLQEHLETSSVIKINSAVIAEWNLNLAENILKLGNYRYRPNDESSPEYNFITQSFEEFDEINRFYTDATEADVVVDGGVESDGTPIAFVSKKEKERLLYSLEDCFGRFRPRSGINKLRYFDGNYTHFPNINMTLRPRYYIADKDDKFKYWSSYRTEDGIERGIANNFNVAGNNVIHDAAPFVVYKEPVPANRIVVKMQTNVGSINLGPFVSSDSVLNDPFFGEQNQTTPVRWRVQYLSESNSWIDAAVFDENSTREDGSAIIKSDGYLELHYGLVVPQTYKNNFELVGRYPSESMLPDPTNLPSGTAYLVQDNQNDPGTIFVVLNNPSLNAGFYESFFAEYNWFVGEEDVASSTNFVTEFVSPKPFLNAATGQNDFREFSFIKGIRIVVETMNVPDSTFDLIEMSPRLVSDISDRIVQFSLSKTASDLGLTGLPVGQLLASVGNVSIFDYDQAFFSENTSSIVSKYLSKNLQLKFYEIIQDVQGDDYYVPIKKMYSDGFPKQSSTDREMDLTVRDLFFYFESITAPQLFLTDVSVSFAVSTILDSIGFSNYTFLRNPGESEDIIPYFYVEPERTVALVLQDIATSTQSAMFFDEDNNFVVASKSYILPKENERDVDITLFGSNDFVKDNQVKNKQTKEKLANIIDVSFQNNEVFNDGKINYRSKSLQRTYGSIQKALLSDVEKTWIYKPALLWEVAPNENTKPINDEVEDQSAYALTALPLSSDLSEEVPVVQNYRVVNNTLDLGDGVYWAARYNGYFFANGEIIKYDAIQFSIPGLSDEDRIGVDSEGDNVWISNVREYRKFFSKIPFNGKIYPTGLVRIYSEPNFEVVGGQTRLKNGEVAKHGRGQFGTRVVYHSAGLADHWTNINNRRGMLMNFKYVFNEELRRVRYANSYVISNEEKAVVKVSDASIARVGDFVARSVVDTENPPSTNLISIGSRVESFNTEDGTITLTSSISNLSDEEFFSVLFNVTNAEIISETEISVGDVSELEEGMYVKNTDEEPETNIFSKNTRIVSINSQANTITLSQSILEIDGNVVSFVSLGYPSLGDIFLIERPPTTEVGPAGIENSSFKNSNIGGMIKNVFRNQYFNEVSNKMEYPVTVQASALVFKGSVVDSREKPTEFVSYVYKPLEDRFKHFGTRMRIIGRFENNEVRGQTVDGSSTYFNNEGSQSNQSATISGGSGGLAIMVNPETNNGYYFEIAALSESDLEIYSSENESSDLEIYNIFFYKVYKNAESSDPSAKAIPKKLFGGIGPINVDEGIFVGQSRLTAEQLTTVYDLAVEYQESEGIRTFYLYINNVLVGIVDDDNPLPIVNNMALFVRGNTKCMFENVYALTENYSQNTSFSLSSEEAPVNAIFGEVDLNADSSFRKYAMSGLIQSTYLSGISSLEPPKYNIYFDEFGTIMREMSYFNVKYDKAYPALIAQISPTPSRIKGFTVSGFVASAYGAEFLVFNHTDTILNLDSTSGNYLRIQGVTLTGESENELTVDNFFEKKSNFSNPNFLGEGIVESPVDAKKNYVDIKLSRMTQGIKDFNIDTPYIQTQDAANSMMNWLVDRIMKPRKSVGLDVFGLPILQLGDIVKLDYLSPNNFGEIANPKTRFVVYNIEYTRLFNESRMLVFLSEVPE
jgi:hypothetical protein